MAFLLGSWATLIFLFLRLPARCQAQVTVYVPFGWSDDRPVSASNLGAVVGEPQQTAWALYERPMDESAGPATLIQTAVDGAYIVYSTTLPSSPSPVTRSYTGPCAINSPIAVCAFEVPNEDVPASNTSLAPAGGGRDDDVLERTTVRASRTGTGASPEATGNGASSCGRVDTVTMSLGVTAMLGVALVVGV